MACNASLIKLVEKTHSVRLCVRECIVLEDTYPGNVLWFLNSLEFAILIPHP